VNSVLRKLLWLLRLEDGPTATEYAVLLGVIAIGVLSAMALFGNHMDNIYAIVDAVLQTV